MQKLFLGDDLLHFKPQQHRGANRN